MSIRLPQDKSPHDTLIFYANTGVNLTEEAETAIQNLTKEHLPEKLNRSWVFMIGTVALTILAAFAGEWIAAAALIIGANVIFFGIYQGHQITERQLCWEVTRKVDDVRFIFNKMQTYVDEEFQKKRRYVSSQGQYSLKEYQHQAASEWNEKKEPGRKELVKAVDSILKNTSRPAYAADAWEELKKSCKSFTFGDYRKPDEPYIKA